MWDQPVLLPDYYIVQIFDRNEKLEDSTVKDFSQNVTGVKSKFILKI